MPVSRLQISTYIAILILSLFIINSSAIAETGTLEPTLDFIAIGGVSVPVQSGSPLPDFEPQDRETISLNGQWKKQRRSVDHSLSFTARNAQTLIDIETEGQGRHLPSFDDSAWATIEIPAVEAQMPGSESSAPESYHNGIWYRKRVQISSDWDGKVTYLKCLGANYIFDLWVNGQWVGVHEGGYTPFAFDLSYFLNYGEENLIAVRIDKPLPGVRQDAVPSWIAMDWWSYTGIIQDIFLENAPSVHAVRVNIYPRDYNGTLDVQVVVANHTGSSKEVVLSLYPFHADPDSPGYLTDPRPMSVMGDKAYLEGQAEQTISVEANGIAVAQFDVRVIAPQRWTPKEPNLYVMHTSLKAGDIMDDHYSQFGIRTLDRDNGKMLLNGRVAFFPGVARHEEWPDTGRTATWEKIIEDLQIIRDLNALFLRTGHYPNHPYTYLATDRLGLSVYAEIPVYWFFGWNWKHQEQRRIADQMFREMVLMGNNRPSIILWGTENECPFVFYQRMIQYNQRLADDFHTNIDDGRLLSQSPAADIGWQLIAKTQEPVDVAGWTTYYGVFYGDDMYQDTVNFLTEAMAANPEHPIISTEYGIWSEADDSDAQNQIDVFEGTWSAFVEMAALDDQGNVNLNGNLSATTWFTVFNWFTKNGLPNFIAPYLQSMGLIHMDRVTYKPVAQVLADAYEPYFEFGGLGPEPDDYVDEEEPTDDDDETDDDDNDDDNSDDDDNDDEDDGCGC